MDDEFIPEPEPKGQLVPPPRVPPTAVGLALLPPAPERRPSFPRRRRGFHGLVLRAMDALDSLGDTIAETIGLRSHGA